MKYKLTTIYGRHIIFSKLRKKPIIIDAGACSGGFVKRFSRLCGEMEYKIFAIECNRDNIKVLKKRVLPNMVLCEKALVGTQPEEKPIFYQYIDCPASGTVGFLKPYLAKHKDFKGIKNYEVDTLPINEIFDEFDIDKIDYMKMNIEGTEKEVLRAMTRKTASKIKQMSILMHTNVIPGISAETIISRLHELGYVAWAVRRKEIYGYQGRR